MSVSRNDLNLSIESGSFVFMDMREFGSVYDLACR